VRHAGKHGRVARRPDSSLRWFAAAFIGALALPALVLLTWAAVDGGWDALVAARIAGAVTFSLLAVAVWLLARRRPRS
jgi:hypothetical protein